MRWHPPIQKHHSFSSHDEMQHIDKIPSIVLKAQNEFRANETVLLLLKEIEDGIATANVMARLEEIISMLLVGGRQRPQGSEPTADNSEPIGDNEDEAHEVNTIGLP